MGLFSGMRPAMLGVKDGKLAPPSAKPNNVHSQIDRNADPAHYIDPLRFSGDANRAFAKLKEIVRGLERTTIMTDSADYFHAETASRAMGFVDDSEFYLDRAARVIHVRAGARLGHRDFNVNRERIEAIRARLSAAGV